MALLVLLVVLACVASLGGMWGARRRLTRDAALPGVAQAAGLHYSEIDLFNATAIAFPVFRAGNGRLVEHVMWRGDREASPPRVFDYGWYEEYRDDNGQTRQRWTYLSCAMAQHNGQWPTVRVARKGIVDRIGQSLGLPTVELESEEFNRSFIVECENPRFATDLLTPSMMDLLLAAPKRFTLETKGRFLLTSAPRPDDPRELPPMLEVVERFLALVPPVLADLYGEFPDGLGTEEMPTPIERASIDQVSRPSGLSPIAQEWNPATFQWTPAPDLHGRDDSWDPTPGVEHDLDGNVIETPPEDPWGDGRPMPR